MIARRHREMEAEAEIARQIARVCTTPQLKKENETLVGWRRQWKPKLDTVYEKKGRRPRKILRKTKSNVDSASSFVYAAFGLLSAAEFMLWIRRRLIEEDAAAER
ncbi:hypothetical protein SASPL_111901 [Salvia splendens]|uniref:Uncharacterized protein n=1 Tax=Salvia splendens TaxID=180675 RepID=A0A8X8YCT3_SALSN|nr:hypothetical protein SASPL_111901 [Salvia splendens]